MDMVRKCFSNKPLKDLTMESTTKKMLISDQKFMTDPKSPLKKAYL